MWNIICSIPIVLNAVGFVYYLVQQSKLTPTTCIVFAVLIGLYIWQLLAFEDHVDWFETHLSKK